MATILEFQRSQRKVKPDGALRARRDCEVVLFPGIRYERWADAPSTDRQPGRYHDHLDLDN